MDDSLKDKRILITGGTKGIGRATAIRLALAGAKVMIIGRHEQELNDALIDIRQANMEAFGIMADTSKGREIRAVFEEADKKMGGIDILINNAAQAAQSIESMDEESIEFVVRTNIEGYLLSAKYALERMLKAGYGHILNVGSMSAEAKDEGSDVYVATKSGIRGFSESLRKSVSLKGIRVTLIEPGLVGTDMTTEQVAVADQPKKEAEMTMLEAEDIADAIHFCLTRPLRSEIVQLQIRPHKQPI